MLGDQISEDTGKITSQGVLDVVDEMDWLLASFSNSKVNPILYLKVHHEDQNQYLLHLYPVALY